MGGGVKLDDDDGINEINVTPLVDVMLVLLVIFLVASVYIVKDAIEVELPKAAKTSDVVETTLSIVIDQSGALYLNGNPTNETTIASACQAAAAENPNAQAIIAADNDVKHGNVIKIIDLVRTNGLARFAINVKRAPGQQAAAGPHAQAPAP
jgi:biopolymer transport protein TolR